MPRYKVHRGTVSLKVNGDRVPTIFHKGEVFESPRTDLASRPGTPVRVELVPDGTPLTPAKPGIRARRDRKAQEAEPVKPKMPANEVTDTYESMTVADLQRHAAAEEISLGAAKSKAEIIAALRAHDAANAG